MLFFEFNLNLIKLNLIQSNLVEKKLDNFRIYSGIDQFTFYNTSQQSSEIEKVINHPLYNASSNLNDIALIKIKNSFLFDNKKIKKACLFKTEDEDKGVPVNYEHLTASFWQIQKKTFFVLKETNLTDFHVYNFDRKNYQSQNMNYIRSKSSICPNSGSPLHYAFMNKGKLVKYVVGIKVGSDCNENTEFILYTKISFYLDWIKKQLREFKEEFCLRYVIYS